MTYLRKVFEVPPYYADQLMAFICTTLENEEATRLTKEFSQINFDDKQKNRRKEVLADFVSLIARITTT